MTWSIIARTRAAKASPTAMGHGAAIEADPIAGHRDRPPDQRCASPGQRLQAQAAAGCQDRRRGPHHRGVGQVPRPLVEEPGFDQPATGVAAAVPARHAAHRAGTAPSGREGSERARRSAAHSGRRRRPPWRGNAGHRRPSAGRSRHRPVPAAQRLRRSEQERRRRASRAAGRPPRPSHTNPMPARRAAGSSNPACSAGRWPTAGCASSHRPAPAAGPHAPRPVRSARRCWQARLVQHPPQHSRRSAAAARSGRR
jgi:hypothetical protein